MWASWFAGIGGDGVVPIAVEVMRRDSDGGELRIGDFDALGIFVLVEFGADLEAGIGGGCSNQLNDGSIAAQGLAPPVDGDEREETVLDLVPFAGARRQMTDRDRQADLIGQPLKLDLPETNAVAIAAAAIGGSHGPQRWRCRDPCRR